MNLNLFDTLKALCEAPGISGFEDVVRGVISDRIRGLVDQISVDRLGNLIATVNPEGEPHVMLVAHMDEIGLIITHVNDDGTLSFERVGGVNPLTIVGRKVAIWTDRGPVLGVIGIKPPHLLGEDERGKVPEVKSLFIDLGVDSREEAEAKVNVGDPVTLHENISLLSNGRASGKALDDRAGCTVLIRTAELLRESDATARISIVFSVQEEVGGRGARVAAYRLNPDVAIAVDVTHAGGYPGVDYKTSPSRVGGGPAISVGTPVDRRISRLLIESAKDRNVKYQVYPESGATRTDMDIVQVTREGVLAGLINIPERYMHSCVEMVSLEDIEGAAEVIVGFLEKVSHDRSLKDQL